MKPFRSELFVPGHKAAWMEKSAGHGADALILDLEDAVPQTEKAAARPLVHAAIKSLASQGQTVSVRVNSLSSGLTQADLEGVVCGELTAVSLPKVERADDLLQLDQMLGALEAKRSIPKGHILTPLVCETAKAMRHLYDIAVSCPRVQQVTLAAGPGGDAARSVGYRWSPEGTETLYLRSKAVLDARAAGIEFPTISSWWNIRDLEGLARDAHFNRQLGFRGMVVMHPTHVPIVNQVFTPSADELDYYRGLVAAMEAARSQGSSAVIYQGDMVDEAMFRTAREMLEFARSIGAAR